MVELRASLTESGILYLPQELRQGFGRRLKILSDACGALVFPEDTDYEDLLGSLDVLRADVTHRIALAKKRAGIAKKLDERKTT